MALPRGAAALLFYAARLVYVVGFRVLPRVFVGVLALFVAPDLLDRPPRPALRTRRRSVSFADEAAAVTPVESISDIGELMDVSAVPAPSPPRRASLPRASTPHPHCGQGHDVLPPDADDTPLSLSLASAAALMLGAGSVALATVFPRYADADDDEEEGAEDPFKDDADYNVDEEVVAPASASGSSQNGDGTENASGRSSSAAASDGASSDPGVITPGGSPAASKLVLDRGVDARNADAKSPLTNAAQEITTFSSPMPSLSPLGGDKPLADAEQVIVARASAAQAPVAPKSPLAARGGEKTGGVLDEPFSPRRAAVVSPFGTPVQAKRQPDSLIQENVPAAPSMTEAPVPHSGVRIVESPVELVAGKPVGSVSVPGDDARGAAGNTSEMSPLASPVLGSKQTSDTSAAEQTADSRDPAHADEGSTPGDAETGAGQWSTVAEDSALAGPESASAPVSGPGPHAVAPATDSKLAENDTVADASATDTVSARDVILPPRDDQEATEPSPGHKTTSEAGTSPAADALVPAPVGADEISEGDTEDAANVSTVADNVVHAAGPDHLSAPSDVSVIGVDVGSTAIPDANNLGFVDKPDVELTCDVFGARATSASDANADVVHASTAEVPKSGELESPKKDLAEAHDVKLSAAEDDVCTGSVPQGDAPIPAKTLEADQPPEVENPAATSAVKIPAASTAVETPAASTAVETPDASTAVETPAVSSAVETPAATSAVESPAAISAVEESVLPIPERMNGLEEPDDSASQDGTDEYVVSETVVDAENDDHRSDTEKSSDMQDNVETTEERSAPVALSPVVAPLGGVRVPDDERTLSPVKRRDAKGSWGATSWPPPRRAGSVLTKRDPREVPVSATSPSSTPVVGRVVERADEPPSEVQASDDARFPPADTNSQALQAVGHESEVDLDTSAPPPVPEASSSSEGQSTVGPASVDTSLTGILSDPLSGQEAEDPSKFAVSAPEAALPSNLSGVSVSGRDCEFADARTVSPATVAMAVPTPTGVLDGSDKLSSPVASAPVGAPGRQSDTGPVGGTSEPALPPELSKAPPASRQMGPADVDLTDESPSHASSTGGRNYVSRAVGGDIDTSVGHTTRPSDEKVVNEVDTGGEQSDAAVSPAATSVASRLSPSPDGTTTETHVLADAARSPAVYAPSPALPVDGTSKVEPVEASALPSGAWPSAASHPLLEKLRSVEADALGTEDDDVSVGRNVASGDGSGGVEVGGITAPIIPEGATQLPDTWEQESPFGQPSMRGKRYTAGARGSSVASRPVPPPREHVVLGDQPTVASQTSSSAPLAPPPPPPPPPPPRPPSRARAANPPPPPAPPAPPVQPQPQPPASVGVQMEDRHDAPPGGGDDFDVDVDVELADDMSEYETDREPESNVASHLQEQQIEDEEREQRLLQERRRQYEAEKEREIRGREELADQEAYAAEERAIYSTDTSDVFPVSGDNVGRGAKPRVARRMDSRGNFVKVRPQSETTQPKQEDLDDLVDHEVEDDGPDDLVDSTVTGGGPDSEVHPDPEFPEDSRLRSREAVEEAKRAKAVREGRIRRYATGQHSSIDIDDETPGYYSSGSTDARPPSADRADPQVSHGHRGTARGMSGSDGASDNDTRSLSSGSRDSANRHGSGVGAGVMDYPQAWNAAGPGSASQPSAPATGFGRSPEKHSHSSRRLVFQRPAGPSREVAEVKDSIKKIVKRYRHGGEKSPAIRPTQSTRGPAGRLFLSSGSRPSPGSMNKSHSYASGGTGGSDGGGSPVLVEYTSSPTGSSGSGQPTYTGVAGYSGLERIASQTPSGVSAHAGGTAHEPLYNSASPAPASHMAPTVAVSPMGAYAGGSATTPLASSVGSATTTPQAHSVVSPPAPVEVGAMLGAVSTAPGTSLTQFVSELSITRTVALIGRLLTQMGCTVSVKRNNHKMKVIAPYGADDSTLHASISMEPDAAPDRTLVTVMRSKDDRGRTPVEEFVAFYHLIREKFGEALVKP